MARDERMACVIVQDLDPDHQGLPVELLARRADNPVSEVRSGDVVEMGGIYVVPPGKRVRIDGDILRLQPFSEPHAQRQPIDDFLVSLAGQYAANAACVVLSGLVTDGHLGLRCIREHGGVTIVHEAEAAGIGGMPGAALDQGPVDFICEIDDIVPTLKRHFGSLQAIGPDDGEGGGTLVGGVQGGLQHANGQDVIAFEAGEGRLVHEEEDLSHTRDRLRHAVDELELANAELRSSNARILLINEALQSTNRGLKAVNDELHTRVDRMSAMQADLDSQRRRLQLALSVAGIGVWEYKPNTGETILDENERILLGIGPGDATDVDSILARIHEDDRGEVESQLRRAISGEKGYDVMFRIRDPSGTSRYLRGLGCIVEGEVPRRMVGVNIDVTAEQALKDARDTMVRELNHRVKNMFAIISGIIAMAARTAGDVHELALDVRNRINALGKAHCLTQAGGAGHAISLRALVETALSPYVGHHTIALQGDDIEIDQDQVTSLGLILHEWATNAVKYGALCNGSGQLRVGWRRRGRNGFELRWSETSVATHLEPETAGGFGSQLVELSTKQLRGRLKVAQKGHTRTMRLEVPVADAATA